MIERTIEKALFASRWLLAPMYLGLALVLIILAISFGIEGVHMLSGLVTTGEGDIILATLGLIDIVLVANLVVMVILSGYENFVSTIDTARNEKDAPDWMGKVDAGTLKIKVAASIVAISSIHLLKAFMNIRDYPNDKLIGMVGIHMTFVISALLLAWIDKIAFAAHREH
ncbi:MAG: TIGR00645 family protein [Alphaproteobacteria bacterium]|nr:TIGR00645 family protein [Alphaproteobacteria bacterium]